MTKTLLPLEQVRLLSSKTGEHVLDTYIEESEKGGRTLPDLLDDMFLPDGTLALNMELRYSGPNIQYRYGIFTDPEAGWTDFLKFHQWEGEYLSGYDYLMGDVVSYGNGIIYFVDDYPNAPAVPDPHTDPKMIWIMDDAFISAILSEMSTLKSDTQSLKDATQILYDNSAQILIDVTAIESNIEAMELNIATMEANVATMESSVATLKSDTQTIKTAAELAQTNAETAQTAAENAATNSATSASEALTSRNEAEAFSNTLSQQLLFKGEWDIATNGLPPTPDGLPERNVFYRTTSSGLVGSDPVYDGNEIAYDYDNATWYVLGHNIDPNTLWHTGNLSPLTATGNLNELTNKAASFNTIKQLATTDSAGVVEEATSSEMTAGSNSKFPDALTILNWRTPKTIWEGYSNGSLSAATIQSYSGHSMSINGFYIVNRSHLITKTSSGNYYHCVAYVFGNSSNKQLSIKRLVVDNSNNFIFNEYVSDIDGHTLVSVNNPFQVVEYLPF